MKKTLEDIRGEIEKIDQALVELLSIRLALALNAEMLKREAGSQIHSPERENNEREKVITFARTLEPTLPEKFLTQLMMLIFRMSVEQQKLQRAKATEHASTG